MKRVITTALAGMLFVSGCALSEGTSGAATTAAPTESSGSDGADATAQAAGTEPEQTEPPAAPEDGSRDNPVPIGQVADVGDGWTMKVNSVEVDGTATIMAANQFNEAPADGKQYVLVNVTVGYVGPDESSSAGVSVAALGQATNNPAKSYDSFVVAPDPQLESFGELFKGGEETGNVAIEIESADAPTLVLIGQALLSFSDKDRKFFAVQ